MNQPFTIIVAAPRSRDCITLISQVEEDFGVRAQLAATVDELNNHLQQGKPDIVVVEIGGSNREFNLALIHKLRNFVPKALILPMIPASRREMLAPLLEINISYYIHTPIEPAEASLIFTRAVQHISPRTRRIEAYSRTTSKRRHGRNIDWSGGIVNFNELIDELETELIVQALRRSQGNKKEAARLLNLKRTTLLEKIKKKDLNDTTE